MSKRHVLANLIKHYYNINKSAEVFLFQENDTTLAALLNDFLTRHSEYPIEHIIHGAPIRTKLATDSCKINVVTETSVHSGDAVTYQTKLAVIIHAGKIGKKRKNNQGYPRDSP